MSAAPLSVTPGTLVIDVQDLRKSYHDVKAVDGVSFSVEMGEVFGMLGPNGAGKTTTVEILEGLRPRDSGSVGVLGLDPGRKAGDLKRKIGVQLQQVSLYPRLRTVEVIELFASFYGRAGVADHLLALLGLEERRRAFVKDLSGGQQQRLSVALAMVNDPPIIFLDEPTTGMDPQARRSLWETIEQFKAEGRTVLLTTHYMEEAERLCDRVAVMDHGRIIAMDTPEALVRAHVDQDAIEFSQRDGLALGEIESLPGVVKVSMDGDRVSMFSDDVSASMAALLRLGHERWPANSRPAAPAPHARRGVSQAHGADVARLRALVQLTLANTREFARDRAALFWTFAFPLLFVLIFGLVFSRDSATQYEVGLVNEDESPQAVVLVDTLEAIDAFVLSRSSLADEIANLEDGDRRAVIAVPSGWGASIDADSPCR